MSTQQNANAGHPSTSPIAFDATIHDPEWTIERSGLLDRPLPILRGTGATFRLAKALRDDATTLVLTFEQISPAEARAKRQSH